MGNNNRHRDQFNDGNFNNVNDSDDNVIEAVFYDDFGDMEWDDESVLFDAHDALTKLNQRSNKRTTSERRPRKAEQWR